MPFPSETEPITGAIVYGKNRLIVAVPRNKKGDPKAAKSKRVNLLSRFLASCHADKTQYDQFLLKRGRVTPLGQNLDGPVGNPEDANAVSRQRLNGALWSVKAGDGCGRHPISPSVRAWLFCL